MKMSSPLVTKSYRINIGHDKEPVVVNVADLYKFHRLKEIADQQRERHRNIQQVFDEISESLQAAWRQPEEIRRQIVKRLYLRWHPDKNLGEEEFCTKAFQHIQSLMSRAGRILWQASLVHGKHEPKNMELNAKNTEKASPNSTVPGNPHRNTQLGRMFRQVSANRILSQERLRAGLDKLKLT